MTGPGRDPVTRKPALYPGRAPTGPWSSDQKGTNMGYGNCGCGPGFMGRRYLTKEEKTEWLNNYAKELEQELKAVKERVKEIQKE